VVRASFFSGPSRERLAGSAVKTFENPGSSDLEIADMGVFCFNIHAIIHYAMRGSRE
jgi:hypothetical protein